MKLALLIALALAPVLGVKFQGAGLREKRTECKIFAMWDYHAGKVPFFIQKDLESWALHSHGRCGSPVLINDTNIAEYIPDLPEEYFRLPDHGSRSDVIRYALIYHHGGIYMDTDILVLRDLNEVLDKVADDYDLISYAQKKSCKAFSSNFLAARKGSAYMKEVWEAQKKAMTSHCESHDDRDTKVCCPANPKHKCHVHWGAIGEMVSHPVFDKFAAANPSMKKHCFAEEEGESFAPEGMGTVLFTKRKLQDALPFFTSIKTKKPMDRLAYHLFNAQGFQREYAGGAIFDSALFVGALYRKSLGNASAPPKGPADDGPAEYCASEGENCPCSGRVFFGRKFDNDKDGDKLDLSEMVLQQYRMMEVNGDIACTTSGFMGDPQINRPKQCLCQAMKGGPAPRSPAEDGPATICANQGEMCECEGKAYYGRKFSMGKDKGQAPRILSLAETVKSIYRAQHVSGNIRCSPSGFGGDPLVGASKHCFCQHLKQ